MSDFEDTPTITGSAAQYSDSSTAFYELFDGGGVNAMGGASAMAGGGASVSSVAGVGTRSMASSQPSFDVALDAERNTFIIVVLSVLVIMGVFFIIGGLFVKAEAHAKSTTRGGQHGDPLGENDMEHESLFNIDLDVWEHPV